MTRSRLLTFTMALAACFTLAFGASLHAEETAPAKDTAKERTPQTLCPVMGNPINKQFYSDYQGQRVYYCCPACKPKFEADPEKYMQQFADQSILLESIQTTCPLSGEPVNKSVYSDYKGRRVYFCCKGCKGKFDAEPAKYLDKLPGIKTPPAAGTCTPTAPPQGAGK